MDEDKQPEIKYVFHIMKKNTDNKDLSKQKENVNIVTAMVWMIFPWFDRCLSSGWQLAFLTSS